MILPPSAAIAISSGSRAALPAPDDDISRNPSRGFLLSQPDRQMMAKASPVNIFLIVSSFSVGFFLAVIGQPGAVPANGPGSGCPGLNLSNYLRYVH